MNPEVVLLIKARNEAKQALADLRKQLSNVRQGLARTKERSDKLSDSLRNRLEKFLNRTAKATDRFSKELSTLAPLLIEINRLSSLTSRGLINLGQNLVSAAADFETYENTIRVFSSSQEQANQRLERLIAFSKELVGLDTGQIINFFGQLTARGLADEEAIQAIKGITEAISEQGKSAAVARQVLNQYVQAVNRPKALSEDFKTIFREVPQFSRAVQLAFGESADSAEQFRSIIEKAGISTQEAIKRVIPALDSLTQGANIDSLNAQLDILQDQARFTAASYGDILVPEIVKLLKTFNNWLDWLQQLDPATKSLITTTGVFVAGVAGLTAVVTTAALAIGAFNAALVAANITIGVFLTTILPIVAVATVVGYSVYQIITRIGDLNENLKLLDETTKKTTETIEEQIDPITKLQNEIKEQSEEQERARKVLEGFQKRVEAGEKIRGREIRDRLDAKVAYSQASIEVDKLRYELDELLKKQKEVTDATDETTESTRNLLLELVKADTALRRGRRDFRTTDFGIDYQTARNIIANINRVADTEIAQAEKRITDQDELAARIQEINDKRVDDITDVIDIIETREKESLDRIREATFESYKAQNEIYQSHVDFIEEQSKRKEAALNLVNSTIDNISNAFVAAQSSSGNFFSNLGDDIRTGIDQLSDPDFQAAVFANRPGLRTGLQRQSTPEARAAANRFRREQAEDQRQQLSNAIRSGIAIDAAASQLDTGTLTPLTEGYIDYITKINELLEENEVKSQQNRLENARFFYNQIQRLQFDSVQGFIQSLLQGTSAFLTQLAIREAADAAFFARQQARIAQKSASDIASAGTDAGIGVLLGPIGIAAAALSIGLGIFQSVRANRRSGQAERQSELLRSQSSRTFQNPANDMLVELAVARALTGRQRVPAQSREIARENAIDVANAVDQGVRSAPPADIPINLNVTVEVPLTDQVVETITYKQTVLGRRGQ